MYNICKCGGKPANRQQRESPNWEMGRRSCPVSQEHREKKEQTTGNIMETKNEESSAEFEEGQKKEAKFHQKNALIELCHDTDGSINQIIGV